MKQTLDRALYKACCIAVRVESLPSGKKDDITARLRTNKKMYPGLYAARDILYHEG